MKIDTCKKWAYMTKILGFGEVSNEKTGQMSLCSNLSEEENQKIGIENNWINFQSYEEFLSWFLANKSEIIKFEVN